MKRLLVLITSILATIVSVKSQELKSEDTLRTTAVEIRLGAEFIKHFDRPRLTLSVSEQIRSRVYETDISPYFKASYTTVELAWKPIDYFKLSGGYTLRLFGNKGWTDPKEFLRHRAFVALTGQYKTGQWKFSLREKLDVDCRTDSVNLHEKPNVGLTLRHKLHAEYAFFGKPAKLYTNLELKNTLNEPTRYLNTVAGDSKYGQYLCNVRAYVGVRWRLNKMNALDLAYRFDYAYERDVNITRNKANVELTHAYEYTHAIVLGYELDW